MTLQNFIFVAIVISQKALSLIEKKELNTRLTCTNCYGKTVAELSGSSSRRLFNQRNRLSNKPFHAYVHVTLDHFVIAQNIWQTNLLNVIQKLEYTQDHFAALTIAVVGSDNYTDYIKIIVNNTNIKIKNIEVVQLHSSNEFGQYPTFKYMQLKATEIVVNGMQAYFAYIPLTGSSNIKEFFS